MGAGSPEFDVNVKGVFAGISPNMKKGHFIRAIMEAVTCMVNRNLESLKNFQIEVNEIRALGGGSASELWNQMKADMTGIPYVTIHSSEVACTGAAILAGLGKGVFRSIEEGCERLVKMNKKYVPDLSLYKQYQQVYQKYIRLYEQLKGW
jgi:xylulokinase